MTDAQLATAKNALQALADSMPPLIKLTIAQRDALPQINEATEVFTATAINAMAINSSRMRSNLNPAQMQEDLRLFKQLSELTTLLREILHNAEHTRLMAGSEIYLAALNSYIVIGKAAEKGAGWAIPIYHTLKEQLELSQRPDASSEPEM